MKCNTKCNRENDNGNKSMKDEYFGLIVRHKHDGVHGPNVQHELIPDFT